MIDAVTRYSIERHIKCLDRLEEDAKPVFGSLDARGMLRHLRFSFESSIGHPDETHINPGLGPLSMAKWSRLHGIHNHHHFKQFQLEDEEEDGEAA